MIKSKLLGSTFMVAGVTIGGGMLAMPLTTAELGFSYTVLLLAIIWMFLTYAALLLVELHQNFKKDISFAGIAENYLGTGGRIIVDLIFFLFLYALVAAYIVGGGSLFTNIITNFTSFASVNINKICMVLFTIALGSFVFLGTKSVDLANRVFFTIKVIFFFSLVALFIANIKIENLSAMPLSKLYMFSATPVLFTSFGFHVIIPSLVNYLDKDIKQLKKSIWYGTSIALIVYILWQISIQGVLEQNQFLKILKTKPNLEALITATQKITKNHWLSGITLMFTSTAVLTAFLGVSLALFDGVKDLVKKVHLEHNKKIITVLTFLPPLLISLFYPDGFVLILGYAGILFSLLSVLIPIILIFMARQRYPENEYKVFGGTLGLIIMLIAVLTLLSIPVLVDIGYLPTVFA